MPEFPRDLPHLYIRGNGKPERYRTKNRPIYELPQRDRVAHGERLYTALSKALEQAQVWRGERNPDLLTGTPGFYLDFQIPPGSEHAAELLESRSKDVELVAFRQADNDSPVIATVFVPDVESHHFLKKVQEYRHQETPKGNPRHQNLIARIDTVALAALRSVYTDDPALLPAPGQRVWWEIWIRDGHAGGFDELAHRMDIPVQQQRLVFPDREVRLVYADEATVGRLFLNSDAIAEVRRGKDTPALFVDWSNVEQAEWAADLADRVVQPNGHGVAVCVLDTGVTQGHPLLAPALDAADVHAYDPLWSAGDLRGHGTNMAGTALYGDLTPLLAGTGPVTLTHCLESVKVLPDEGQNEPKLYGAITRESVARAEVGAPERRRAVCLAVTSDIGTNRGRPSSWSAAVDQLCFEEENRRLILISAGNVRDGISKTSYPFRNETEPIENPGQSWNAITVGAYTEKTNLVDPTFAGWEPVAPAGELCPTSRTSMTWERRWPIKPDIVLEGGNWAFLDEDQCDCPHDLGILTTYRDPTTRHFDIFRDTSAATALAGNLAGSILAAMPQRWPETIRALIVHSAEWTPPMRAQFEAAATEQQKRNLLRKYGYGVPSYERAVLSSINDLTLIAEEELQPFWKDGSIKTRDMNLHELPWPRAELEQLADTQVEFRITLSYYVEPNPGERGWVRRHRYASHALRFAMQRPLESVPAFRRRINDLAAEEEEDLPPVPTAGDEWFLGRSRNAGSIHSDYWRGSAADLAARRAIGVYPVGGWWKENPGHQRYERKVRYALIASIRATNGEIDIYTPVQTQITTPVGITT